MDHQTNHQEDTVTTPTEQIPVRIDAPEPVSTPHRTLGVHHAEFTVAFSVTEGHREPYMGAQLTPYSLGDRYVWADPLTAEQWTALAELVADDHPEGFDPVDGRVTSRFENTGRFCQDCRVEYQCHAIAATGSGYYELLDCSCGWGWE